MKTKTIKTTKGEFVDLFNGLTSVKDVQDKKFAIAVGKNLATLMAKLQHVQDANTPSSEFFDLSVKVNELVKENTEEAAEQVKALEVENEGLIKKRHEQLAKVQEMLKERMTVKLYTIESDYLPEKITPEQVLHLNKIIQ